MKRQGSQQEADNAKKAKTEEGPSAYADFDLSTFWAPGKLSASDVDFTPSVLQAAEKAVGYKLPASYVELLKNQNGGCPMKNCAPCTGTSYAKDHCGIENIYGVGGKGYSIDGPEGCEHWFTEWEYPRIGVVIAGCPSGGHDLVMLDYRECGKQLEKGEPTVVHVDQDADMKVTLIAPNFAAFIKSLKSEDEFDGFEDGEGESGSDSEEGSEFSGSGDD